MQAEVSNRRLWKRRRNIEETEVVKFNVFNVLLDSVIGNMTTRFVTAKQLNTPKLQNKSEDKLIQ